MNFETVKEYIKQAGLPNFRIKQVQEALFKKGISSWDEASNLPAALRENLKKDCPILSFTVAKIVVSLKSRCFCPENWFFCISKITGNFFYIVTNDFTGTT